MIRLRMALGLAAAFALSGCAGTLNTPHAVLERGEIAGELAYQGAVSGLDVALAQGKMTQADHDAAWRKAWHDLQDFRTLYNAGQSTAAALDTLHRDKPATSPASVPGAINAGPYRAGPVSLGAP